MWGQLDLDKQVVKKNASGQVSTFELSVVNKSFPCFGNFRKVSKKSKCDMIDETVWNFIRFVSSPSVTLVPSTRFLLFAYKFPSRAVSRPRQLFYQEIHLFIIKLLFKLKQSCVGNFFLICLVRTRGAKHSALSRITFYF